MSESSEYICISCWTPFEGVPDEKRELTCPHCGFVQPAGNDSSEAYSTDNNVGDMTMQDVRAPWLDSKTGDEPIAFDNLEQLEQLLGNSGQSAPTVKPADSVSTPSEQSIEPAIPAPITSAPDDPVAETTETPQPPALEAITTEGGPTIWRMKSDSGMTYSFFSLTSLVRWADGLAPQEKAALTSDGVIWKRLRDFRSELEKNDDPTAAFEAAPVPKSATPTVAATASTTGKAARPSKGKGSTTQSRRRPTRTASATTSAGVPNATGERTRAAGISGVSSEMEELMKAASASEDGGRTSTQQMTRRSSSTSSSRGSTKGAASSRRKSATSAGSKAALFGFGALLGGFSVYFGMYLLGFYDLVFAF
ncbi:MAG: hypothetical protein VX223_06210 [Myxococcota bacterium]|nr:hypothetical protein [Myxococcota bacterium]